MQVTVKPELEKFIDEKVKVGQFDSPSDMVNMALNLLREQLLLKEQEEFSPAYEKYIRRELEETARAMDRGEFEDFTAETIIAEGHKRLAARKGKT